VTISRSLVLFSATQTLGGDLLSPARSVPYARLHDPCFLLEGDRSFFCGERSRCLFKRYLPPLHGIFCSFMDHPLVDVSREQSLFALRSQDANTPPLPSPLSPSRRFSLGRSYSYVKGHGPSWYSLLSCEGAFFFSPWSSKTFFPEVLFFLFRAPVLPGKSRPPSLQVKGMSADPWSLVETVLRWKGHFGRCAYLRRLRFLESFPADPFVKDPEERETSPSFVFLFFFQWWAAIPSFESLPAVLSLAPPQRFFAR